MVVRFYNCVFDVDCFQHSLFEILKKQLRLEVLRISRIENNYQHVHNCCGY